MGESQRDRCVLFCGDVMLGRGIDQIQARPGDPHIQEPYVRDAREYVRLAELAHGTIPKPVPADYIWGDALEEARRVGPAARVVNLETSITRSDDFSRQKEIHYRMHPANIGCLRAFQPGVCTLANNHVLDYGARGLVETLEILERADVRTAGAGRTLDEARRPAVLALPAGGRLLVFACGIESSGIAESWTATATQPGLDVLPDLSETTARQVSARVVDARRPGDVAVLSIHWGSNWGATTYPPPTWRLPTRWSRAASTSSSGIPRITRGRSRSIATG